MKSERLVLGSYALYTKILFFLNIHKYIYLSYVLQMLKICCRIYGQKYNFLRDKNIIVPSFTQRSRYMYVNSKIAKLDLKEIIFGGITLKLQTDDMFLNVSF